MPPPPQFPPPPSGCEYQLGMLNPPRRVKRLRDIALKDTSSTLTPHLPSEPSLSQRSPTPPPSAASPRRRGRKPAGPLSKSAREQLRKTNHSVIEKRRREKINEALAALRELVPGDGERKEDKEFKLEILVRTVEYLRIMVAKVKNMEAALGRKCAGKLLSATSPPRAPPSPNDNQLLPPVKRKRVEYDADNSDEDIDKDEEGLDTVHLLPGQAQTARPGSQSSTEPVQPCPRLPSISSWMMNSPTGGPLLNSHAYQLPSPPQTVPFPPSSIASTGLPPKLVLPSPIGPIPPSSTPYRNSWHRLLPNCKSPSCTYLGTRDRDIPDLPLNTPLRSSPQHPLDPPPHALSISSYFQPHPSLTAASSDRQSGRPDSPWSRDDQTAASLLLNIASRHSCSGSDEEEPHDRPSKGTMRNTAARCGIVIEAQTPSSMLGMAEDSGDESPPF